MLLDQIGLIYGLVPTIQLPGAVLYNVSTLLNQELGELVGPTSKFWSGIASL
jgi:hypothetical protein